MVRWIAEPDLDFADAQAVRGAIRQLVRPVVTTTTLLLPLPVRVPTTGRLNI